MRSFGKRNCFTIIVIKEHKQIIFIKHTAAEVVFYRAEVQALNHEPMYMKDWLQAIDDYLKMTRREILTNKENILSPVEKDFIQSMDKLEQIGNKKQY